MVAVYYVVALRFTDEFVSSAMFPRVFPTSGAILLAALLVTPPLQWWTILGAALVAHWTALAARGGLTAAILVSFTVTATCAAASALLLRRQSDRAPTLDRVRAAAPFLIVVVGVPLVCVLGSGLWLGDRLSWLVDPGFLRSAGWVQWLVASLGTSLAYLTVVPLALAAYEFVNNARIGADDTEAPRPRLSRAALLGAAIAVATFVAFAIPSPGMPGLLAVALSLPLLLIAAVLFHLTGAAWALLIVTLLILRHVAGDSGPTAGTGPDVVVLPVQVVLLALGAPLLLLGASTEERQRANHRLLKSDERNLLAARGAHAFVVSYDPGTGLVEPDPVLGALLGVTPRELEHPDWWWRHVHPDDVPALRGHWAARPADAAAARVPLDFRMIASGGRVLWFRNHSVVRRLGEFQSQLLVTLADVTELRAAESIAEQRNRELAHVSRTATVGELAAAMAHEIRQPLTAILVNAQTATRLLDGRPDDQEAVREILRHIAADGRRAGDVIQRMRAFARKGEVEREPVDLNAAIRTAVQFVGHDTIRRRVDVQLALAPEPLVVIGDRMQVQQVMLNLVLNALEAIAEGDPAAERVITISSARSAPYGATVTILDTGPGIPEDRREAIFAPFVTSKPRGLGMGLAISRTIVEAHGGMIWCETNPSGRGAAFVIALPLAA